MLKVMIAEDDVFISDMLEMALIEGGYEVCGIARTVREAIVLDARHDPDLAILDLRLAEGGLGTEIAAQIKRPGGPGILYATGNPGQVALTAADGEACLSKPYPLEDVIRSLEIVTEIASTGKALPPFPAGLELLGPAPGDVARATPKPQPRTPRHEATPATDGNVFAQELQHRVRNNLQAIHGMLAEQIQITADDSARHGLSTIAHRVTALAEIYNHLLGAGLSQTIDLGSYLASLCASFESLEQERHPLVKLTCRWDVVSVDLDNATVLGLVVAELISNSYDHAFGSGAGTITVSLLCSQPGDQACIVFADDGSGFDETGKAGRHGLGLVRRLMQQVNGLAAVRRHNGTEWLLKFPTSLPAERSVGITATLQTV